MTKKHKTPKSITIAKVGFLVAMATVFFGTFAVAEPDRNLSEKNDQYIKKSVIVELNGADYATFDNDVDIQEQRDDIKTVRRRLINSFDDKSGYIKLIRSYDSFPVIAFEVDEIGEAFLRQSVYVRGITDDRVFEPQYDYSTPIDIIDGSISNGFSDGLQHYDGSGYAIAVIDSGVDKNHEALQGKVIEEYCFGANSTVIVPGWDEGDPDMVIQYTSLCPGQAGFSNASDSALDCTYRFPEQCGHGTMVAAAAVMPYKIYESVDSQRTAELRGVATGASIIAFQVSSLGSFDETTTLDDQAVPVESSLLGALDYIATHDFSLPIAAVNISIGTNSSAQTGFCDSSQTIWKNAIGSLKAKGIATVFASGNEAEIINNETGEYIFANKQGPGGCIRDAVSVSSVNNTGDIVTNYAQNALSVDLLAPGGGDWGSSGVVLPLATTGSRYTDTGGTSFAAPVVTGAFAVLRQKFPLDSVDELLMRLEATGKPVVDARPSQLPWNKPLIQVDSALKLDNTSMPTVARVEINNTEDFEIMLLGGKANILTRVAGFNDPSQNVEMQVLGMSSVSTRVDNGILTIGDDEDSTYVNVKVTSVQNPSKYEFVTIRTLSEYDEDYYEVLRSAITTFSVIRPDVYSVNPGGSAKFSVKVDSRYASLRDLVQKVDWSVSGATSLGTTISNDGLLTVGADETSGVVQVRATSDVSPNMYSEVSFAIEDNICTVGCQGGTGEDDNLDDNEDDAGGPGDSGTIVDDGDNNTQDDLSNNGGDNSSKGPIYDNAGTTDTKNSLTSASLNMNISPPSAGIVELRYTALGGFVVAGLVFLLTSPKLRAIRNK